ncbi:hypothetical protein [Dyadobacter sp. 676]|uniref:DUF4595 domain-containing protein n=1 Tax=Dyadobacter sp. 676 TaxID=3088362 RepID=A0AAU8FS17_9BACT
MKNLKLYAKTLFVFLVASSCSLQDHPPQPSCTYLGYLLVQEVHNGAVKTVYTDDYNIDQTSDLYPTKTASLRTFKQRDTVANLETYTSTDSDQSTYNYNSGYLTQIVRQDVTDRQSETDNIFFLQYRTKKLRTETSEITDFKYENGTLKEVDFNQTVSYITSNIGTISTTLNSKGLTNMIRKVC